MPNVTLSYGDEIVDVSDTVDMLDRFDCYGVLIHTESKSDKSTFTADVVAKLVGWASTCKTGDINLGQSIGGYMMGCIDLLLEKGDYIAICTKIPEENDELSIVLGVFKGVGDTLMTESANVINGSVLFSDDSPEAVFYHYDIMECHVQTNS